MDSIIPLGQKNTLAEYMILSGADNRPPILDKDLYDSWKSILELYMQNREHRRMILESVENGLLIWPTVDENGVTETKKYAELSATEVAKDLWERVQLLMQGTSLTNDMNIYNMKMEQFQVNTKFLNRLPPEWRDGPIACLNKSMAFLTAVASSRFPSTNNQLKTSSNPRNQATIQDVKVTVQQVQGRQRQSYSGTGYKSNATNSGGNNASGQERVVKCYNCQGEGHMARQCTQPKRPRNAAWYKVKAMLVDAQEAGQILDEEKLAFLADLGTEDLDTYYSDCDDISNAKAVLMTNISNCSSDVISEVPHSETCLNDMENQSVHAMQDFEQTQVVDFTDNEIHSDSNIIPYSQYLQEPQQANVQDTNLQAQQDSMILYVIKQMSEQMINHDLKAQIQDKVFVITSLKNDLRKVKGKEIVDIAAQIPSTKTIFPGIFKLDLEPLAPRLLQNREAHIDYLKYTQEQADILRGIVEQAKAKQPLDNALDFTCLSKNAKIVESKNANHSEPNHTWGSNAIDIPSSSSLVMTGTVRFENDHIAGIMGYGDYQLGNVTISRVYYVEGLGHNLTKDEAPEAIIKCIKNIQVRLNATGRNVRTDNGTEFVNQTLYEFYENVGISHQTFVAHTPQQNDVVERRN
ncbi:integrase, catalytic region, zinc finger, CCHC-type containing protein [Tanacetum coccineum]